MKRGDFFRDTFRPFMNKKYHSPRWFVGILLIVGMLVFGIGLDTPVKQNFDEFHYIPAAQELLDLNTNRNWEHPPLGKILIAFGMFIGGDNPIGWRWMSVVFGAATLAITFLLALELFGNTRAALLTTGITFFNHLLYVQSRIAMLDIFMLCFLWIALLMFLKAWKGKGRRYLIWCGVFVGLSVATKWFAIVAWLAMLGLALLFQLFKRWHLRFPKPRESDWWNETHFRQIGFRTTLVGLLIVPLLPYLLSFAPLLLLKGQSYSWTDFWSLQVQMWDGQKRVTGAHPYNSHWWQWILLFRPMWYAFDREAMNPNIVRGVFLIGNPALMWTGVLAIIGCIWIWIETKRRSAFFITYFYLAFYLCWILIPRSVHFYYYYIPAGMLLSFAVVECFERAPPKVGKWGSLGFLYACALVFIFFFPILSGMPIPADSFRRWMWFSSWI